MSYAETHAKRFASCAANATKPARKRMFERLAKQWAARALETIEQRAARLAAEEIQSIAWGIERAAKSEDLNMRQAAGRVRARLWAAKQAKRYAHETPEMREARQVAEYQRWQERKKLKRGRVKQEHFERSDAAKLIAAWEAERAAKRDAPKPPTLPPLPY